MLSKKEILNRLENEQNKLESLGVSRIGVFGSFSRGEQEENSDIDFLVEFKDGKKTYRNFISLKRFLEDLFGRDVDLVTKESIKPSMKDRILDEVSYGQEA
jgi:predicted nucleotidyltransferase